MIATKAAAFISISAMMILLTLFHSIVYYSRNPALSSIPFPKKYAPPARRSAHFIYTYPKSPGSHMDKAGI